MAKFVYKFEPIKRIKETFKKKINKELSIIDTDIEKMNKNLKNILEEIKKTKDGLSAKKHVKVSEMQFINDVEHLLDLDAQKIRTEITRLEQIRENKLAELIERSKEHKMFETLEDKYQEDFTSFQNHKEQKDTDEMAVNKYIRET